ncbi:MAG: LL-diaminopimelate aminotransferase [Desulfovibrionaceae bacterium]
MNFPFAERISSLPPYLFAGIDKIKKELMDQGVDIISLGIGDPDLSTPDFIIDALKEAASRSVNHRYPSYVGMQAFRKAVSEWYEKRFTVSVDPNSEVIALIGSKEGISHFPFAFVNPGDLVLVPSPAYPVYGIASSFAGAIVKELPLLEENAFLPNLNAISADLWDKAKIIYINYPNNPTSASAPKEFYEELIDLCKKHNVIIVHDNAYSEIYYSPQYKPVSIFEFKGAKDVAIEFHSLSKTYNMTGWRVGMAIGNSSFIAGLGKVKENMDSGVFQAIQEASIVALRTGDTFCDTLRTIYKQRRDVVARALSSIGIDFILPEATFYIWAKVPMGYSSSAYVSKVLEQTGVVLTPGSGFGNAGEGYFRISLTVEDARLEEAVTRMASLSL